MTRNKKRTIKRKPRKSKPRRTKPRRKTRNKRKKSKPKRTRNKRKKRTYKGGSKPRNPHPPSTSRPKNPGRRSGVKKRTIPKPKQIIIARNIEEEQEDTFGNTLIKLSDLDDLIDKYGGIESNRLKKLIELRELYKKYEKNNSTQLKIEKVQQPIEGGLDKLNFYKQIRNPWKGNNYKMGNIIKEKIFSNNNSFEYKFRNCISMIQELPFLSEKNSKLNETYRPLLRKKDGPFKLSFTNKDRITLEEIVLKILKKCFTYIPSPNVDEECKENNKNKNKCCPNLNKKINIFNCLEPGTFMREPFGKSFTAPDFAVGLENRIVYLECKTNKSNFDISFSSTPPHPDWIYIFSTNANDINKTITFFGNVLTNSTQQTNDYKIKIDKSNLIQKIDQYKPHTKVVFREVFSGNIRNLFDETGIEDIFYYQLTNEQVLEQDYLFPNYYKDPSNYYFTINFYTYNKISNTDAECTRCHRIGGEFIEEKNIKEINNHNVLCNICIQDLDATLYDKTVEKEEQMKVVQQQSQQQKETETNNFIRNVIDEQNGYGWRLFKWVENDNLLSYKDLIFGSNNKLGPIKRIEEKGNNKIYILSFSIKQLKKDNIGRDYSEWSSFDIEHGSGKNKVTWVVQDQIPNGTVTIGKLTAQYYTRDLDKQPNIAKFIKHYIDEIEGRGVMEEE